MAAGTGPSARLISLCVHPGGWNPVLRDAIRGGRRWLCRVWSVEALQLWPPLGVSSIQEDPPVGWVRSCEGEVGLQALLGGAHLPWEEQVLLAWQGLCTPPLSEPEQASSCVQSGHSARAPGGRRRSRCPLPPSPAVSPRRGHGQWELGGCLCQRPPDRLSPVGMTSGAPSNPDGLQVGAW